MGRWSHAPCFSFTLKVTRKEQRRTPHDSTRPVEQNWAHVLRCVPAACPHGLCVEVVTADRLNNPGAPRWPLLFTDNVRVNLLLDKVTAESLQHGGMIITDLRTRDRSYWMHWTLIFCLNEFEVSGNASRPSGAAEKH